MILPLSACASDPSPEQLLEQNQERWETQKLDNYRYRLQVSCYCIGEVTNPVVVEIRNGETTSIVAADSGKPVNRKFFNTYDSVLKLFDVVQKAIDKDYYKLDVTYDANLGYPTQIDMDFREQIADDERTLTIGNLEELK
ncbi:DUF6174 domain-containing protein [Moorena producens JHB]|uniref:DUF6174 domain-containing protein n=1 Tax=Moorena producens (strain JHB) TaxID=1454205 RepID=A0A1D9G5C2_MOOP1|nr:DUF6174 domain-containing protein [Moorena producens]AOY82837.1 DUF6174 domain-containing protein [Moorena producens JHB]